MFFNKRNQLTENDSKPYEDDFEPEEIGLVIHFTPHIVYLYLCEDGVLDFREERTYLEMTDKSDRYIGVSGTFITLELKNLKELPLILEEYGLNQLNVPIVQKYVSFIY